jgi:hypothetical protein
MDIACVVAAHAALAVPGEAIPALRLKPGPAPGPPPPPSFLKQADEQTIAGLSAVYHAMQDHHLDASTLSGWGVLAAPQLLGRNAISGVLERFAEEGAWGMSPHLIPHRTLHSVSGTISQALALHGPNFGVGGGPGAAAEVILVAAALLAGGELPGLWVVLTGSLPAADQATESPAAHAWEAVALALTPATDLGKRNTTLTLYVGIDLPRDCKDVDLASWPLFSAGALVAALARGDQAPNPGWRLQAGGWLRLCRPAAGPEGKP